MSLTTWTEGLMFPEGPVLMADGSILLSEILGNRIVQVWADGTKQIVAEPEGMPNGLAFGPDGFLYCTNMGGLLKPGVLGSMPGVDLKRLAYRGGSIQRIDTKTGECKDILTECEGHRLRAPDDLVFDSSGGFWFTDIGVSDHDSRKRDETGIYYVNRDMTTVKRVLRSTVPTNGIGISPEGDRLYWTEYLTGRLFMRRIVAPGELAEPEFPFGDCIFAHPLPVTWFDSLTIGTDGQVAVAVHNGTSHGRSGIITFSPEGEEIDFVAFDDPWTTHALFSFDGEPTAFVTLSGSGRLVSTKWSYHQARPNFGPR